MADSDAALREFIEAIVAGDGQGVARLLSASPGLAAASFDTGATRGGENSYFLDSIKRWIYARDTALHMAAAAYQTEIALTLIGAGANVGARNRRGQEALHYAAIGSPGSVTWNPGAQAATIVCLIEAGADPNAVDMDGVTPLHRAVRTRCAEAARTLLAHGADPARKNKSGSTPMQLANLNTGRGGTGSAKAKAQQAEIVRVLEQAVRDRPHSN
ncbi:MAG TPA: ankyrin repeat domain-containing protein [Terracidiphilus sp.]